MPSTFGLTHLAIGVHDPERAFQFYERVFGMVAVYRNAEFVQAQWKQNLGITVPLKNMEFRTFLPLLNKVDYEGFARRGWVGDYMDPYTFLSLYYEPFFSSYLRTKLACPAQ